MKIRKAKFSGSWYPENANTCEKEIQAFLKQGKTDHVKDNIAILFPIKTV